MSIIEELWYGNLAPCKAVESATGEITELSAYIERHKANVYSALKNDEKHNLDKLICSYEEYSECATRTAFQNGFKIGLKLAFESLLNGETET